MKSRQVGFVLIAMIVIGVAGLVIRVVSSGTDEVVLSGLLPISSDVVNRVVITKEEEPSSEAMLVRLGDTWTINNQPAFTPKLDMLWTAVSDIQNNAQLVATNPRNHKRMGVEQSDGIVVSFYLDEFEQEKFIIGKWSSNVGLCYIRRPQKKEVYGIPCPAPVSASEIFDPRPEGWLDPIIISIPRSEVESVAFTYPDDEFVVSLEEGDWVLVDEKESEPANLIQIDTMLRSLELLFADGFASEEESRGLDFEGSFASVRIVTASGASVPTTRLRILERDDISYYLKTPARPTIFIVNKNLIDLLLRSKVDFSSEFAN